MKRNVEFRLIGLPTLRTLCALLTVLTIALWIVDAGVNASSASTNKDASSVRILHNESPAAYYLTPTPDPCFPVWVVAPSYNAGTSHNFLEGIEAVSANNVWAVGAYFNGSTRDETLTQHWDGSTWSVVPSPNLSASGSNYLDSVAVVSSNDIWAVGHYRNNSTPQTLIEHWDGSAWSIVPSPNAGTSYNFLYGVAAVTTGDVWAVGSAQNGDSNETLVEHWDGSAWSVVPSPNAGSQNYLHGIAVVSANDIWAVGSYYDDSALRTLTEHWDGSTWSVVSSPNVGANRNYLYGVEVVSANDIWAVGEHINGGAYRTLTEHWDGSAWSVVPSPNVGQSQSILYAVAAVSAGDVWAVGEYLNGSVEQTLIEHWDGSTWSVVPSPNAGANQNSLHDVAVVSPDDLWAAGQYDTGTLYQTLVERYGSPCITPSPTPTSTPIPAHNLVGHVTWQGRPAQPNSLQQLPLTITLKSATTEANYPVQNTDINGFFTVSVDSLPDGIYNWRVKGPDAVPKLLATDPPGYLANCGTVSLTGVSQTDVEIGQMLAGDANNDNIESIQDFNILKVAFGTAFGGSDYDNRADWTGDLLINIVDFNLLKRNFGTNGCGVALVR